MGRATVWEKSLYGDSYFVEKVTLWTWRLYGISHFMGRATLWEKSIHGESHFMEEVTLWGKSLYDRPHVDTYLSRWGLPLQVGFPLAGRIPPPAAEILPARGNPTCKGKSYLQGKILPARRSDFLGKVTSWRMRLHGKSDFVGEVTLLEK